MIRFLFIFFFLVSIAKAEDTCTYKTEQVIENGNIIKEVVYKSCSETELLNKKNFFVKWITEDEYQNSVILVVMALIENL